MNPIDYWYKKYIALKECERIPKPELTWEDIKTIHHIAEELKEYLDVGIITPFCASEESFYTEVLRRFNEAKK